MPPGPPCFHSGTSFQRPFTIQVLGGQTQTDSWQACGSPQMDRSDRTPLVDFCNQNNPRAQPCDRSIPSRTLDAARPACAELGGDLRKGLGPLPPRRTPNPGGIVASSPVQALRLGRGASAGCQPRFHEPGTGRLSPPGTSRPPARKQVAELCPDPIHSDTSRRETVAALEGEPSAAATASPHKPALVNTRTWAHVASARPAFARPAVQTDAAICLCRSRLPARNEAPTCLRRGMLQPRAASPEFPRRNPGSAAPEVPSINELPSGESKLSLGSTFQAGHSPQLVANLWRTHGAAFRLLHDPTVLTYRGRGSPCLRCN